MATKYTFSKNLLIPKNKFKKIQSVFFYLILITL